MDGDFGQSAPKEQVVDRPPKRIRELHFGVLYVSLFILLFLYRFLLALLFPSLARHVIHSVIHHLPRLAHLIFILRRGT